MKNSSQDAESLHGLGLCILSELWTGVRLEGQ